MLLEGERVVVTGAASGVGFAVAKAAVSHGAAVIGFDISEPDSSADFPSVRADICDPEAVSRVLDEASALLDGVPTVLAHCAAVQGDISPIRDADLASWRRLLEVNVMGTLVINREAVRRFLDAGHGNIVNTASNAAIYNYRTQGAYNVSKSGVINITKTLANEIHGRGVRVNCVCPGGVETPLLRNMLYADHSAKSAEVQSLMAAWRKELEAGEYRTPDEVVDPYLFLMSSLSANLNGQFIRSATKNNPLNIG